MIDSVKRNICFIILEILEYCTVPLWGMSKYGYGSSRLSHGTFVSLVHDAIHAVRDQQQRPVKRLIHMKNEKNVLPN